MSKTLAIASLKAQNDLQLIEIDRRPVGDKDVQIKVKYCGMCHSDIHTARDEWGPTRRACVTGHEIIGTVTAVGSAVTKYKVGDIAAVGCMVDSCGDCNSCNDNCEQYCEKGFTGTYGAPVDNIEGHTKGGYSGSIVVTEKFVLKVPPNLDLAAAAPLLCAGVTVWSPIRHYGVKKGDSVAVLGLGGLGHMAVKFLHNLGCHTTVMSRTNSKEKDARELGADDFLVTSDADAMKKATSKFDFIIDTVSADHDINAFLGLIKRDGTLIIVGGVPEPLKLMTFSLITKRRKIGGSLIGGIKETQEMLDFCGEHNITSSIELVSVDYANKAWDRMMKSDVKFRFVLDIEKTLKEGVSI